MTAAALPADAEARPLRAAAWMGGAIMSFSAMALAGRSLGTELDTFEIMTYRSFVGIAVVLVVGGVLGRLGEIDARRLHLHATRNFLHFTGQNLWFFAVTLIPFAQLFALEFTSPLWVALLAPALLGERLTRMRLIAAALGFVGVLIVARPGAAAVGPGTIAALAAAVCFAATAIATKRLTRTASIPCILFWLTTMQAAFGLIAAGWDGDIATPSATALPLVILVGCAGLVAHLCMTTALSLAPATLVIPVDFLRLPLIAVVGAVFYAEPLDPFVIVGAAVIFAANYANLWHETRRPIV